MTYDSKIVPLQRFRRTAYSLVKSIYNKTVYRYLPKKIGIKNGVAVRNCGLFDINVVDQTFEAPSVASIQEHVKDGDIVLILGGGWGITPVHAARQGGSVTVIEAARERAELVQDTAELNNVDDCITVRHATVETNVDVWGTAGDTVPANELPECDVLEIDVEGAERDIVPQLDITPRIIILEIHPDHGTTEEWARTQLSDYGYEVLSCRAEVPDKAIVITAKHK